MYFVHEHVFTCINIRVLRDTCNWILIVLPIGLYTRITDHDWLEVKSSIPKISTCNIKDSVIYTVIHYNLYPKLGIIFCIKSLKALNNLKLLFLFSQTTGYFQQTKHYMQWKAVDTKSSVLRDLHDGIGARFESWWGTSKYFSWRQRFGLGDDHFILVFQFLTGSLCKVYTCIIHIKHYNYTKHL